MGGLGDALAGGAAMAGEALLAVSPVGWVVAGAAAAGAAGYGVYNLMIDDDSQAVVDKLEKEHAFKHNLFGDSEITNWVKVAKLSDKELKSLKKYDDFDDVTNSTLDNLIGIDDGQRKVFDKQLKDGTAGITSDGKLSISPGGIKDYINLDNPPSTMVDYVDKDTAMQLEALSGKKGTANSDDKKTPDSVSNINNIGKDKMPVKKSTHDIKLPFLNSSNAYNQKQSIGLKERLPSYDNNASEPRFNSRTETIPSNPIISKVDIPTPAPIIVNPGTSAQKGIPSYKGKSSPLAHSEKSEESLNILARLL